MCVHTDTCSHPPYKPCLVKTSQHLICLFWPPLPQGLSAPIPGSPRRAGRTVPAPTGSACLDACAALPYPPRFQGSCYHLCFLIQDAMPSPLEEAFRPSSESWAHKERSKEREGRGRRGNLVFVSVCIVKDGAVQTSKALASNMRHYLSNVMGFFLVKAG